MSQIQQQPEYERVQGVGEYFAVSGDDFWYAVSGKMARFIERELSRWPRKTWVTFVDLNGSRVRLRARAIRDITQWTPGQRAANRAFFETLRQEEQDEEAWD